MAGEQLSAIAQLKAALSEGYSPSGSVKDQLKETTIVALVGSLASGKTSVLRWLVENDQRFGRVQCFTTRPRRKSDEENEFRFKLHTEENLQSIADAAEKRELVQYMLHPTNNYVYGSELEDYSAEFSLLETIYYAVEQLYTLPVKKVRPIYVVPDVSSWQDQLHKRAIELDEHDVINRLEEAVKGARWAIDAGDSIDWVYNAADQAQHTAGKIRAICEGEKTKPLVDETAQFVDLAKQTITLLKS